MPWVAKVIADSISTHDRRVVTMELTYPLIVHNELLTHRALWKTDDMQFDEWLDFSRSSSSNRAITSAKLIEQVMTDPYIPNPFQRSTRGMIAGSILSDELQQMARASWLRARDAAVAECEFLAGEPLVVHKQWRNRLIGPFQWITTVATGNAELWEHFFALRDHSAAQPDFALVAHYAHEVYRRSQPRLIKHGQWHTPFVPPNTFGLEDSIKLAVARSARTSFLRQGEFHEIRDDFALFRDLRTAEPRHDAPAEHALTPIGADDRVGNFVGWCPLRHSTIKLD